MSQKSAKRLRKMIAQSTNGDSTKQDVRVLRREYYHLSDKERAMVNRSIEVFGGIVDESKDEGKGELV